MCAKWTRAVTRALLPARARWWLRRQQRFIAWPPVGQVDLGALRRLRPISRIMGLDRGSPVDRHYIERFLAANASDIHGRVLEIEEDTYTRKFGGDRVIKSDVLMPVRGNEIVTIVADLTRADQVPSNAFDCIILTQTLQVIYEVRSALGHLYRILKPGGVLLATGHGISQIGVQPGEENWGEFWRFTTQSMKRLFEEFFSSGKVTVEAHGNVLAAVAFLHGLAAEELTPEELDHQDPDYELLITVRAVK